MRLGPTLVDFAEAWTDANANRHQLLTAEYAFLTDLRHSCLDKDWKNEIIENASRGMAAVQNMVSDKLFPDLMRNSLQARTRS